MSRRNFRGPLRSPRPKAAYGMCAASTATLALSDEIHLLFIAAAAALGLLAWLRAERSHPWQENAALLNSALLLSVGACATLWFLHWLAIVALAHFATLALALKLIDARPRRSEFLLVGLSLLQVVAASSLTDSALFPLCLAAYSSFTVWTLLAHTVACEAHEAGRPGTEREVLSAGLLRLTLFASLLTFALALVIFPLLPRIRAGVPLPGGGPALARSGFSDHVSLGDIGRIRQDSRVALRVDVLGGKAPAPEDAYWRGLAFDRFDGRTWSVGSGLKIAGDARVGLILGRDHPEAAHHRIVREPVAAGVLFTAGPALGVRGPMGRVERDGNGSLYARETAERRVEYRVRSGGPAANLDALRADRAAAPPGGGERYLALPRLSPRFHELARQIVSEATGDYERSEALRRYLTESGHYTDAPPAHGKSGAPPIEDFLFEETAGHCEYFASAFVLLARSAGLPARLVTGFAGGRTNSLRGFIELTQADAHSWAEVHFAAAGWVRFDPTPPDLRLAGSRQLSAIGRFRELTSAVELWWFRNFVDYDRERQIASFSWLARRLADHAADGDAEIPGEAPTTLGTVVPFVAAPIFVAALILLWLRRGRGSRSAVPESYRHALALLRRQGWVRSPNVTARDFAAESGRELPPEAAWAFRSITESYLASRFGGAEIGDARRELAVLRVSLRSANARAVKQG